jgi:salicylate hydroxylase
MLDKLYHAGGVERLVRNEIFEGRTPAEYYDRVAWLFTPPAYVRQWRALDDAPALAANLHTSGV